MEHTQEENTQHHSHPESAGLPANPGDIATDGSPPDVAGIELPVKLIGVKEGRGKPYGATVWSEVRAAYEAGEIATDIAPRYGMAPGTIYTRASKESWTRTKSPVTTEKLLDSMSAYAARSIVVELRDVTFDICRAFSVLHDRIVAVSELKKRKRSWQVLTLEAELQLIARFEKGATAASLAPDYGLTEAGVRGILRKHGVSRRGQPRQPVEIPPDPPPPEPPPPWKEMAHAAQQAPEGAWRTWLFQGGRGAGKTRAGAEWFDALARANRNGVFALVGATYHDVREVMIDGESGIMNLGRGDPPYYEVARRRLRYSNGAVAFAFSAEESRRLRGPQFHGAWADEFCAWTKPSQTLAMLRLALRRGPDPRLVVTTTPKAIPELRALHGEKGCVITRAGSDANADNLSPSFIEHLRDIYGGTALASQELDGVMLDDAPGVMWTHQMLRDCRGATPESFERVIVAVDPPVGTGGSACGIVVAARRQGRGYVLADYSVRDLSPLGWARRVCEAARDWKADAIVAESNQGGDMVRATLAGASPVCGIELVRAFASKTFRAAPVSMLYERGRITHCGDFAELEEEMMAMSRDGVSINRAVGGDRVDALVWALSQLLVDVMPAPLWRVRRL
jgi:phage terminase large subunit-like protein